MKLLPTYSVSAFLYSAVAGDLTLDPAAQMTVEVQLIPTFYAQILPGSIIGGGSGTGDVTGAQIPSLLFGTNGQDGLLRTEGGASLALSAQEDYLTLTVSGGFLPRPDLLDETDPTYFYFGWDDGDDWKVERQVRLTSQAQRASIGNNPTKDDLDAAWPDRTELVYG